MRTILIIGSGKSTSYLIKYLLDNSISESLNIRLADKDSSLGLKLLNNHSNGTFIEFDIFNKKQRETEIKNSDIEDLLKFRNSRHYMQWAGIGAVQQIASNELSLGEAFEALSKTVNIVDIPHAERDQIIARILKEN